MVKKFFVLMVVWAFAFGVSSSAAQTRAPAQTGAGKIAAQPNNGQLVNLLPASDGAASINMRRLLSDALPQILSGNQSMLRDVLRHIDDLKTQTGIDLRQFEQIAVGVSVKQNAARKMDFEPVVLARGTLNANALIDFARTAAGNGKYREERFGDRTIYIFTPKNAVRQNSGSPAPQTSVLLPGLGLIVSGDWLKMLSNEVAVSRLDAETLAIGSPARLRETFGTGARLGGGVLAAIDRKPESAVRFAVELPPGGLASFIKLNNDELGNTLASVRLVSGAVDVSDGSAVVSLMAKTAQPEQAASFQEQLEGFQSLGKVFLGGSKEADKQLYARLIEKIKIARQGNEVTIDLQVLQGDISFLLNNLSRKKDAATSAK